MNCTCGNCDDSEQAEQRHGLSQRERLARDPNYADWLYEQRKDREIEKEMDKVSTSINGGIICQK